MNELKQIKLKNDYKRVAKRIRQLDDFKKLSNLANNIRKKIDADADYKHFAELALTAEHKSKVVRVLSKCPSPSNQTLLEQIAFSNFVEGTAHLNKTPSPRVIHHQLKKLGYAKTLVRQVEKEIGNDVFFNMASKGIVKHTSEFFVYRYAKHLVEPSTYTKIANLFRSNEQLLQVA